MATLRQFKPGQEASLDMAHEHLRQALACLKQADCPKSANKVRSALKSTEGAQRHMRRRLMEATP